jgi:hypothetical protein
MNRVIVDTSAWIAAFRLEGESKIKDILKNLILEGSILIPGIIKAEILRGAKSSKEYETLNDLLKGLTHLPVKEDFWNSLSRFSFNLFRRGVTVPLIDTLIALLAIENDVPLLHQDKHFDLIAQETSLKILEIS